MKSKQKGRFVALLGIALILYGAGYVTSNLANVDTDLVWWSQDPQPQVIPDSAVVIDVPSEELKALVSSLRGVIVDRKDAIKTSHFFLAFADVVARDKEVITSTAILREGFIRAEKLMLQETELVGKYPGFGLKKDAIIIEAIGLDNVELDAEKRAKAVAVLRAIAWMVGGDDVK